MIFAKKIFILQEIPLEKRKFLQAKKITNKKVSEANIKKAIIFTKT